MAELRIIERVIPIPKRAGHLRVGEDGRLSAMSGRQWCDMPIRYPNGNIAYDFPERIPGYLKMAVAKEMDRARAAGTPYKNDHKGEK